LFAILAGTVFALAAAAYGANWTIQPTLAPAGPAESALTSVSCVSAAACVAVGTTDDGHASESQEALNVGSFAETWNGTAWTARPTDGAAGPNPWLNSVSCASATFCVAVGRAHAHSSISEGYGPLGAYIPAVRARIEAERALVEVWNGTNWTVQPNPGAALPGSGLNGVTCRSSTFCIAVGFHLEAVLVEVWNGTSWRLQGTPRPGAAPPNHGAYLEGVTCTASSCTAVGGYNANPGTGIDVGHPLAERWDGRRWSVEYPPTAGLYFPELFSVSCVSGRFCLAVGTHQLTQQGWASSPFAERWNGTRWAPVRAGLPKYSPLYGVSCVTTSYCLAAGQFDPQVVPAQGATEPLLETWNGARWVRTASPAVPTPALPRPETVNQLDPSLMGISCLPGIGCIAVGAQADGGSNSAPLAQSEAGAPSAPAQAPEPVFGRSADLKTVSGTVSLELPGTQTFVPLSSVSSVPVGTTIDATNGTVQLTSAADKRGHTQTGQFYSGIFRFTQTTARSKLHGGRQVGITVLALAGGSPTGCGATGARAEATATRTARRLWGNAHGNFRTQGRYASATVRGTNWLTEDTCGGTLVKVVRGVISVDDLPHHRTVLVRAPHSFLAHPGPGG
jgi:hypothetical protein